MGYCMHLGDSRFRLANARKMAAFAALNTLARRAGQQRHGHFAWVETKTLERASCVEDHLREWRWRPVLNDQGDIAGLHFEGEKLGDDKQLLDALAPFVDAGSFLVMHGEDGAVWRWYFDGSTCVEQAASMSFGPVPGDVVDVEAREVHPGDRALEGPQRRLPR